MVTGSITARLGVCAALALAAASWSFEHGRPSETGTADNLASLRAIHDATAAGDQVAYREVGGRIVIDSVRSDVQTAEVQLVDTRAGALKAAEPVAN